MRNILFILSFFFSFSSLSSHPENLEELLHQFDSYAEKQRQVWDVTGMAIGIVKEDKVLLLKGYGQRGIENKSPVDKETLFQIGSLSKAFTSALTAIAIDEKKLKWDDKVIDHFPSFRMADPWVTTEFEIADLFAQRSGLPPYAGDAQAFLGFDRKDILANLHFLKPISSFRSSYAYQNGMFLVASHLLELKERLSYEALLEKKLFLPLGMNQSSATLKAYLNHPNRAEWLMRQPDGKTILLKENFPYANWNYVLGPAGGINSTIQDMTKWMMLQANQGKFNNKQLISVENMEQMSRPMIFAGKSGSHPVYYALGWLYMPYHPYPIIWHNGATLGVYNAAAFIPEEKLGIVVLSNVRETQLSLALVFQFFDMYFKNPDQNWSQRMLEISKKEQEERLKKEKSQMTPPPSFALSAYTGTYHHPIYGEAFVKEENNQLILIMGKNQVHLTMTPWKPHLFNLKWPLVEEHSRVLFLPNTDGIIETMEIHSLSKEGNGLFQKIKQNEST